VNQKPDRRADAVAIVATDPVLGALVGAAVEVIGYRAEFPQRDESPVDALRRIRPAFLLIDCEDSSASDEALLGRGLMSGARSFLFGSAECADRMGALAVRFQVELLVLPRDLPMLREILSRRVRPLRDPQGNELQE
jgi:hypothetical protein